MAEDSETEVRPAERRVMVYVDGFNLYYGLRAKGWRRFYWLDMRALSENLLRRGQRLAGVRYFTTRIAGNEQAKRRRQSKYLEALASRGGVTIHYGHYLAKRRQCRSCGARWTVYEEKMTDVNIAVELMGDAQDDRFDTAIVLSADSDLSAPVEAVIERYPDKRAIAVFPPRRRSDRLRRAASASFTVGRKVLKDSQMPDRVVKADGFALKRPARWR